MPSENPKRRNKESKPHVVDALGDECPCTIPPIGTYQYMWEVVEGSGKDRVVTMETVEREFLPESVEAWDRVWLSQLAAEFRDEMQQALRRWIILVDRFNRGDHSVTKDLLPLEKEFALTWSAQKRERLKFEDKPKDGAGEEKAAKQAGRKRQRNLRVV
jgi:hypothetical protein